MPRVEAESCGDSQCLPVGGPVLGRVKTTAVISAAPPTPVITARIFKSCHPLRPWLECHLSHKALLILLIPVSQHPPQHLHPSCTFLSPLLISAFTPLWLSLSPPTHPVGTVWPHSRARSKCWLKVSSVPRALGICLHLPTLPAVSFSRGAISMVVPLCAVASQNPGHIYLCARTHRQAIRDVC